MRKALGFSLPALGVSRQVVITRRSNPSGRKQVRTAMVAVVMSAAVSLGVPAFAQSTGGSDGWDVTVSPYILGAAMSGSTTIWGIKADVDVSASDIFSNLKFGAAGVVVARKGNWGVGADAIYTGLGASVRDFNTDVSQGGVAVYGLRRLMPAADLTFGARVNTASVQMGARPFDGLSQSRTWVDPLVGIVLHTPDQHRAKLRIYSEVGGFGIGSDFAWQVFPVVMVRVTGKSSIDFGYRWQGLDYKTGEGGSAFGFDVLSQGPVLGMTIRF